MFRVIWLLKRKKGMTFAAFRDYYETHHRVLAEQLLAGYAQSYERYYLYPVAPDAAEPIYDVVMQLVFPDRETYERLGSANRDPERAKAIKDDEGMFLDRDACLQLRAEDSFSKLQAMPPTDTLFKTVWLGKRREDLTPEQFKAFYENKHRLLGEYIMNGHAYCYDRHYLYPITPDGPQPPFAMVMQMDFPSQSAFEQAMGSVASNPTLAKFVAEDEERFIARGQGFCYRAELSASTLAPLTFKPAAE